MNSLIFNCRQLSYIFDNLFNHIFSLARSGVGSEFFVITFSVTCY